MIKKSDDQTNMYLYRVAANITEYLTDPNCRKTSYLKKIRPLPFIADKNIFFIQKDCLTDGIFKILGVVASL